MIVVALRRNACAESSSIYTSSTPLFSSTARVLAKLIHNGNFSKRKPSVLQVHTRHTVGQSLSTTNPVHCINEFLIGYMSDINSCEGFIVVVSLFHIFGVDALHSLEPPPGVATIRVRWDNRDNDSPLMFGSMSALLYIFVCKLW
jgi:hypothetical protein